ncbi:MAG: hypothetical protein QXT64_02430 [Desulfurococcaceae archaeon]
MPKMVPETWIFKASIPANQAANSILVAQAQRDPLVGFQSEVQLNIKESVVLDDIYIRSSADVGTDGVFIVEVDGERQLVTPPVSTLLVSNPQRPRPLAKKKIVLGKGSRLTLKFINLAAGGASATTTTAYVDVVVFSD